MRLRRFSLGVTVAGLLLTTAVRADDAEQIADVRCLVVTMQAAQSSDETLKSSSFIATMYFLGRLDGHDPNYDIETGLLGELAKMTQDDIRAEAQRCGAQMIARGQSLQEMGKDMMRKGKEQELRQKSR